MTDPESILQLGIEAAREGNNEEARSLFRLLTREHPDNVRGWFWLAGVAENREERQMALEQVLALDPGNELALQSLNAMGSAARPTERLYDEPPGVAPPAKPTPETSVPPERPAAEDEDPFDELDSLSEAFSEDPGAVRRAESSPASATSGRRPLEAEYATTSGGRTDRSTEYEDEMSTPGSGRGNLLRVILGAVAVVILLVFLAIYFDVPGRFFGPSQVVVQPPVAPPVEDQTPTDTQQPGDESEATGMVTATEEGVSEGTGAEGDSGLEGTGAITATEEGQPPAEEQQPTEAQPPAEEQPPSDLAAANPAIIPPNTPLEANGWQYNFSTPAYAAAVAGNWGALQPQQGRSVLVLVLVSNTTGQPQQLPADFFVIKDAQNRIYYAQPQASTLYLNQAGRGSAADLSQEDTIPADGLARSMPLLFDIPPGATDLRLFSSKNPNQGWLVLPNVQ